MAPRTPTITAIKPIATVPLSTEFCANDADVVIRAAGTRDFRAHKFILSLASPTFKDMFAIPQPPPDRPGALPHVDVHDSAEAWENILRTIYPTLPNCTVDTLTDLESLLLAARAYEMQPVIETHRKALERRAFVEEDPLRLYSIACACGFEDLATFVARNAELATVTKRSGASGLKGLNLGAYSRLVSFLVDRDRKWQQILGDAKAPTCYTNPCRSQPQSVESFYNAIKKNLQLPYLQTEEVYLKALEHRSRSTQLGCQFPDRCPFANVVIKEFVERRIKEREKVCDDLQPTKWFA